MNIEMELELLSVSNELRKKSNDTEFIVYAGREIKRILGGRFNIGDYSYKVFNIDTMIGVDHLDGTVTYPVRIDLGRHSINTHLTVK